MEFDEVIQARYSVRKFSDKKVPKEIVDRILEVGRIAPSAGNCQPTVVYALDNEALEKLRKIPGIYPIVFRCNQLLVVCYNKDTAKRGPEDAFDYGITDASIVTTYMMLKITELGLGSVWVGWFDPEPIKEALGIPDEVEIVSLLPFGYIAEDGHPSPLHEKRKPMEEFRIDV